MAGVIIHGRQLTQRRSPTATNCPNERTIAAIPFFSTRDGGSRRSKVNRGEQYTSSIEGMAIGGRVHSNGVGEEGRRGKRLAECSCE